MNRVLRSPAVLLAALLGAMPGGCAVRDDEAGPMESSEGGASGGGTAGGCAAGTSGCACFSVEDCSPGQSCKEGVCGGGGAGGPFGFGGSGGLYVLGGGGGGGEAPWRCEYEWACAPGPDDDRDGLLGCSDDDCCADPECVGDSPNEYGLAERCTPAQYEIDCSNGLDDDGDGRVDCFDSNCCWRAPCSDAGGGAGGG